MRRKIKKEIEVDQVICDGCGKTIEDDHYGECSFCEKIFCSDCAYKLKFILFRADIWGLNKSFNLCPHCLDNKLVSDLLEKYRESERNDEQKRSS